MMKIEGNRPKLPELKKEFSKLKRGVRWKTALKIQWHFSSEFRLLNRNTEDKWWVTEGNTSSNHAVTESFKTRTWRESRRTPATTFSHLRVDFYWSILYGDWFGVIQKPWMGSGIVLDSWRIVLGFSEIELERQGHFQTRTQFRHPPCSKLKIGEKKGVLNISHLWTFPVICGGFAVILILL